MARVDIMSSLPVAQPRVTAHELVHDTLRRAILGGALPGGTRLVQADIASQLSVSTTPVREALRDLVAEGLVVFRPHVGAVVRELSVTELTELYDIRKALEPLAIRRAAELITSEALAGAAGLASAMEQENDPMAWAALNRTFHTMLEEAARASFIHSVLRGVQDIAVIYEMHSVINDPAGMSTGNEEHRELLAALQERDANRAAKVLVEHLDYAFRAVLRTQNGEAQPPGRRGAVRTAS